MSSSFMSRFVEFLCSILFLGFVTGLYAHKNMQCILEKHLAFAMNSAKEFSIIVYLIGGYFTINILTWYGNHGYI